MNVLVLGSEGQIGSALMERLKRNPEYDVQGFDLEHGFTEDMRDDESHLCFAMDWADFVFFLAFDVGGSTYLAEHQNSVDFLSNNVRIMDNFAHALQYADEVPDFVFASSQMSNMLHSQYGVLKRLGEFYTEALHGINVRFWNVYGNEHVSEKFHVVTDFVNQARSGQPIRMRTTGDEERQMLHADDAARALEALMVNAEKLDRSKYYDITSFDWMKIRDIGALISWIFNVNCIKGEKTDEVQLDSRNEPTDEILKYWKPEIGIEEGVLLVIDAMKGEK